MEKSTIADAPSSTSQGKQYSAKFPGFFKRSLDKTIPYPIQRWLVTLVLAIIFFVRVYYAKEYVLLAYIMESSMSSSCYISCLDHDLDEASQLPIKSSDEFKPIVGCMSEFRFWCEPCMDKYTPYPTQRWLATLVLTTMYTIRIHYISGFLFVTMLLGLHVLQLLGCFLSLKEDPNKLEGTSLTSMPEENTDEFNNKPFVRRLPELEFWLQVTIAICACFIMTFIPFLNLSTVDSWKEVLLRWFLFGIFYLYSPIKKMIKHKYFPFSVGKKPVVKRN